MRIGEGLSLSEKLGYDCFDFLLAIAMAVDGLDEFTIFVVGDDAVAFPFVFLRSFTMTLIFAHIGHPS